MSGGSFNYLYRRMSDGDVDGFAQHVDRMVEVLERTALRLEEGKVLTFTMSRPLHHPFPEPERTLVVVRDAIAKFREAATVVRVASEQVRPLADIAQAIEWTVSGDSGDDDIVAECRVLAGMSRVLGEE